MQRGFEDLTPTVVIENPPEICHQSPAGREAGAGAGLGADHTNKLCKEFFSIISLGKA